MSDDYNVYFFDAASGALLYKEKAGSKVFDCAFDHTPGEGARFVTAGTKHVSFWSYSARKAEKGLFGNPDLMTSFACAAFDN
jgi:hypothetical protein